MNFSEVLTWDFLLRWEGRATRSQYWAFVLVYFAVAVGASMLDAWRGGTLVGTLVALAMLYPSIVVTIRRWHDRDKSGWWVLLSLVPLIGAIWTLVECGCLRGTPGPNRFGPDPLATRLPA